LVARHKSLRGLVIAGAWLAVIPSLVLVVSGADPVLRSVQLLALGIMALSVSAAFDRLCRLIAPAALASVAGLVALALMVGQIPPLLDGFEAFAPLRPYPTGLFIAVLVISLIAAAGLYAVGHLLAERGRNWWLLGALATAVAAPAASVRFTWPVVAIDWLAMACLLALTILAARERASLRLRWARRGPDYTPGWPLLPPVWTLWLLAVAVGIAGWSTRELRVEVFALPIGLALFAAGWIDRQWLRSPGLSLAPGVAATLGPSTLAIGTDPLTWRAITVLVLAVAFMTLGALRRWRAPTLVGAASMGLALVLVFSRHRDISEVPWLLALLVAGGCLMALAIYFELRTRGGPKAASADQPTLTGQPPLH
jgi:hypothetical protein